MYNYNTKLSKIETIELKKRLTQLKRSSYGSMADVRKEVERKKERKKRKEWKFCLERWYECMNEMLWYLSVCSSGMYCWWREKSGQSRHRTKTEQNRTEQSVVSWDKLCNARGTSLCYPLICFMTWCIGILSRSFY